ncbi:MAG: DUF177 domain-containing protein [Candidatus Omnitrophota bacterium]
MKIDVNQIPAGGFTFSEELSPLELGLETEAIKFRSPIKITADVSRISNVVSVDLAWDALVYTSCGRCLKEIEARFKKRVTLNYPINPALASGKWSGKSDAVTGGASIPLERQDEWGRVIDLDPEIREEIILDYPVRLLCSPDCKGLCPKCGKNLNEGGCSCGTT